MADDVPTALQADAVRLRQILGNLISNAVKCTEKGNVVIRVALIEEQERTARVHFSVTDTGIGIPPELQAQLFESFIQVHHTHSALSTGTGLGLAIVKQLTGLMGGQVGADSSPGKGSTFWVALELRKRETQRAEPAAADRLDGSRVLVVDDNETSRELLLYYLRGWKAHAEGVASGKDALIRLRESCAEERTFDVIVIDWDMPRMDGEALLRAVEDDTNTICPGIVMMFTPDRPGMGPGVSDEQRLCRLRKPIRKGQLLKCLLSVVKDKADRDAGDEDEPRKGTDKERTCRVLVAEDNELNQKVALSMLQKLGYAADIASDGEQALARLGEVKYDLVLMDCQMPGLDGFETSRRIRDQESAAGHPRMPIIAMTANAMHGDRDRCIASGMDDYLPKPVKLDGMEQMLERWLSGKALSPGRETPAPPLNPVTLENTRQAMGDGFTDLVEIFLADGPSRIEALRTAVSAADTDGIYRAAHSLKGSCNYIGADQLVELCTRMEKTPDEGRVAVASELLEPLETEFYSVRAALQAEVR